MFRMMSSSNYITGTNTIAATPGPVYGTTMGIGLHQPWLAGTDAASGFPGFGMMGNFFRHPGFSNSATSPVPSTTPVTTIGFPMGGINSSLHQTMFDAMQDLLGDNGLAAPASPGPQNMLDVMIEIHDIQLVGSPFAVTDFPSIG